MNAKPTLEILPTSLISNMVKRATLPTLEVWTSTPRAFTADTPSKRSSSGVYAHRSHRHQGTKGEK